MATQSARDDHLDVRLEPMLAGSDPQVPLDDAEPTFEAEPPKADKQPEHAVANRYLLREQIGWGQFGEIYEAVDLNLSEAGQQDHHVVLERVTLSRAQGEVRRRLADEFLTLLSVSHPNIARVLDFGVDGTTTFFTSELLEGVSLRSILDSDPTDSASEKELLAVVRGISDGLGFLHGKGLIHGALKPESIFVTTDYEVKIVDLASARLARTRDGSTEMRFGGSLPLDATEDVFGLACLVYEWLSHEPPFGDMSSFEAFRSELSPRRVKGVPRERWKALSRALELQPEARTPTIAEFASEFGVTGTETLAEAEPKGAGRGRRLLRAMLGVGAIAGLWALAQPNYESLREGFATFQSELRGRAGTLTSEPSAAEAGEVPAPIEPVDAGESAAATAYPYPTVEAPTPAPPSGVEAVPGPSETQAPAPPVADAIQVVEPAAVATEAEATSDPDQGLGPGASAPDASSLEAEPAPDLPLRFAFAEDSVTVSEGDRMVSIVVQRSGGMGSEASMIWWTAANTASPGDDYAELGVSTEQFSADQDSMTLYVPLVSDSLIEQPESFNVYLSWDSAQTEIADTTEVFVIDDDA